MLDYCLWVHSDSNPPIYFTQEKKDDLRKLCACSCPCYCVTSSGADHVVTIALTCSCQPFVATHMYPCTGCGIAGVLTRLQAYNNFTVNGTGDPTAAHMSDAEFLIRSSFSYDSIFHAGRMVHKMQGCGTPASSNTEQTASGTGATSGHSKHDVLDEDDGVTGGQVAEDRGRGRGRPPRQPRHASVQPSRPWLPPPAPSSGGRGGRGTSRRKGTGKDTRVEPTTSCSPAAAATPELGTETASARAGGSKRQKVNDITTSLLQDDEL
jgi:hypothetical protein